MGQELIFPADDRGGVSPHGLALRESAEIVELSERLYTNVWRNGLRVAFLGVGASALSVALKGALIHQNRAWWVLGVCALAVATGVAFPKPLYRGLRRRPEIVVVCGLAAGLAQWWIGPGADAIYVSVEILLGVLGLACGWRWLVPAGLLAAGGQAASVGGPDDTITVVTVAVSLLIVPLAFAVVTDRLAGFILRLNQAMAAVPGSPHPSRADASADPDPQHSTPPAPDTWRASASAATSSAQGRRSDSEPGDAPSARETNADSGSDLPLAPENDVDGENQPPRVPKLTSRQLQALLLASQGLRHLEIAECLSITVRQVNRLLTDARERNDCKNTRQLIALVRAAGIIPGEDPAR